MAKWGTTMAKLVHSAYNIFTQTSKHKSNMQSSRDFLSFENSIIHICVRALRFQRTNHWYSKQILHSIWTLMFRFICINKATWDLHSNDPGSHMHVQEKVSLTYYQYVDRMQMGVANPTIYDRCDCFYWQKQVKLLFASVAKVKCCPSLSPCIVTTSSPAFAYDYKTEPPNGVVLLFAVLNWHKISAFHSAARFISNAQQKLMCHKSCFPIYKYKRTPFQFFKSNRNKHVNFYYCTSHQQTLRVAPLHLRALSYATRGLLASGMAWVQTAAATTCVMPKAL